jgi:hypothetical protein
MADDERPSLDRDRIALAIQQPWAELILRGVKTFEIRSQPTQLRGTIYVYASKRLSQLPAAETAVRRWKLDLGALPLGRVVGSVDITDCRPARPADHQAACVPAELLSGQFAYALDRPLRLDEPRPVRFLPYGVWFYPFRRRPTRR